MISCYPTLDALEFPNSKVPFEYIKFQQPLRQNKCSKNPFMHTSEMIIMFQEGVHGPLVGTHWDS